MSQQEKKHPCKDCLHCQWCGEDRCRLCRKACSGKKMSIAEQIAHYEHLNRQQQSKKTLPR